MKRRDGKFSDNPIADEGQYVPSLVEMARLVDMELARREQAKRPPQEKAVDDLTRRA
jgi:hypothetical protein